MSEPDSNDIGQAARTFQDEQGTVSSAFAFQEGAKWAIKRMVGKQMNARDVDFTLLPVVKLEEIKDNEARRQLMTDKRVLIYSREHKLFWRPESSGYTDQAWLAGEYQFPHAWRASSHCGAEKGIEYIIVG